MYSLTLFAGERTMEEAIKENFDLTIRCLLSERERNHRIGTCLFANQ
jgi:hypothetical protein